MADHGGLARGEGRVPRPSAGTGPFAGTVCAGTSDTILGNNAAVASVWCENAKQHALHPLLALVHDVFEAATVMPEIGR
jgi:hypothetical protein